jgi:undecaprenyl-diphosphatase
MFKLIPRDASVPVPAGVCDPSCASTAKQLFVGAALLAGLAAAALVVDLPIARFVKDYGFPGDLQRLIRRAEVFGWGGSVALIIATAATLDPRGWWIVPRLAVPAFGAGVLADCLKLFVARLRPSAANLAGESLETFVAWLPLLHRDALGQTYGYRLQSFPSAHAATAAGLAVALAAVYPRGRWLFAAFALFAALQRIEGQAHFASDVLAGAAIGCVVAAVSGRFVGWDKLAERAPAHHIG